MKSWTSIVFLWEAGPLILVQIWHDMMSYKKQKWNKLLPFFMQDVFLQDWFCMSSIFVKIIQVLFHGLYFYTGT